MADPKDMVPGALVLWDRGVGCHSDMGFVLRYRQSPINGEEGVDVFWNDTSHHPVVWHSFIGTVLDPEFVVLVLPDGRAL